MKLRIKKDGWWVFRDVIANGEEFRTYGALYSVKKYVPGHVYDPCNCAEDGNGPWGRLPKQYWESVNHADYVIYSYSTPIAWHDYYQDKWVMPDEKYSATTSDHQSLVCTAISELPNAS